jgi:hypothetical protein
MGLMTSLAIGAALGGGLLAGKKLAARGNQQQQQSQTAPAPGALDSSVPQPPMTDVAANQAAAVNAGNRQRKKAALGAGAGLRMPKPGALKSTTQPKTLVGY